MKQTELVKLGFKKKKSGEDFWFELRKGKHKFITNDNHFNEGRDEWHVGYINTKYDIDDYFWFNNNLNTYISFKLVFIILTGE